MPKLALETAPGGEIEFAEFPLTTPAPGTTVLKLRMAGICGSDLHIFRGELPLPCLFAMGHEMAVALTADADADVVAIDIAIFIDKINERLYLAAYFGTTRCIDASGISTWEVTERVHKHTDGIGADWVLEVVGVPGVVPDGVSFLNNGSTLLEVGTVGMGRTFEMDPSALVYGNKSSRGVSFYEPVTLAIGLSIVQHTSFPSGRLTPKPFHLADVNDAFAAAESGLAPRDALVA